MDLSVVCVTHGGRELALATLRSARAAAGQIEVEWLVVDSGSQDGTPEAIEAAFPDVRVVRRDNVGFAAATNVALPHARGRYVLLLNPDIEVERGTLAELVRLMDERPEVGLASVVQLDPDGTLQASIRRFPSAARQLGEAMFLPAGGEEDRRRSHYERERSVEWVVGAFLLARREALDQVGPLDERFFLYSEEADWAFRFRAAGWDVRHLPAMAIVHHAGHAARPDLYAQNSHSKLLFAEKHLSRLGRLGFHAALALRHALRAALLAPVAAVVPSRRVRWRCELAALRVVLRAAPPPFTPAVHELPAG